MKIVKDVDNVGPSSLAWKEYKSQGFAAKDDVVDQALKNAKLWLLKEKADGK